MRFPGSKYAKNAFAAGALLDLGQSGSEERDGRERERRGP